MITTARIVAVSTLLVAGGAGCAGGGVHAAGAGSCAFIAHFRGHTYTGMAAQVAPTRGPVLGTARIPGCNDTGTSASAPVQRIRVAKLDGVSASVALAVIGQDDTVLIRRAQHLPPAVVRLVHAPTCARADAPLTLSGPWRGILGADGKTELDMKPPYDLSLLVRHASAARYARAFLTVRVPRSLGRPLTERDIHISLLKGGTITTTVTCRSGRYVASSVTAAPPG